MSTNETIPPERHLLTNPRKWALLTGAGFSANWGFPIAQEIWSFLISDPAIQENAAVRTSLLSGGTFNYEAALAKAQSGEFGSEGKGVLENAIGRVFDNIQTRLNNDDIGLENWAMGQFVRQFMPRTSDETGLFFTLNQDMLVEATTGAGHFEGGIIRPGAQKPMHDGAVLRANYGIPRPQLGAEPNVKMKMDSLRHVQSGSLGVPGGSCYYIKLHGSWDWEGPDKELGMVMGGRKEESILESPLLTFYQGVFKEYLTWGDRRLLIIGYGFADTHINRWISNAIQHHGLRIFIWDRRSPEATWRVLSEGSSQIWKGLCGYSQASLRELLTLEGSPNFRTYSREFRRHMIDLFGLEATFP